MHINRKDNDMSDENQLVEWGDTVHHERFGMGRVLTIEGAGHRTEALIDFNGNYTWVVVQDAPLALVHKRHKE